MLAEANAVGELQLTGPPTGSTDWQNAVDTITSLLLTSLVHDLRSPVSAISAGAELLLDVAYPCPHSRRLVSSIYHASRRIEELCQDLISVCRGKREQFQVCTLVDLLQNTLDEIAHEVHSQGICVETFIQAHIHLYVAKKRMERVFLNLLNNSLESMPRGGCLRISARVEGNEVVIEVADTGSGVPDYIRDRLFLPFVTAGKKNGLGLGLAVSRHTVLEHGGDLWLMEKPGPGAVFCLRLPCL